MIRKGLAILILFLYVPSAIGMNINIHYCGGKISSINFGYIANEGCTCGGTPKIVKPKHSCCKDVHLKAELKSKQSTIESNCITCNLFAEKFLWIDHSALLTSTCEVNPYQATLSRVKPPDLPAIPKYIHFCVYRI